MVILFISSLLHLCLIIIYIYKHRINWKSLLACSLVITWRAHNGGCIGTGKRLWGRTSLDVLVLLHALMVSLNFFLSLFPLPLLLSSPHLSISQVLAILLAKKIPLPPALHVVIGLDFACALHNEEINVSPWYAFYLWVPLLTERGGVFFQSLALIFSVTNYSRIFIWFCFRKYDSVFKWSVSPSSFNLWLKFEMQCSWKTSSIFSSARTHG